MYKSVDFYDGRGRDILVQFNLIIDFFTKFFPNNFRDLIFFKFISY